MLNYKIITEAIYKVMLKRYKKTHNKKIVRRYLEHLKNDTWKNNYIIYAFIDNCIAKLEEMN